MQIIAIKSTINYNVNVCLNQLEVQIPMRPEIDSKELSKMVQTFHDRKQ